MAKRPVNRFVGDDSMLGKANWKKPPHILSAIRQSRRRVPANKSSSKQNSDSENRLSPKNGDSEVKESADSFQPPSGAIGNAKKVLAWKKKYGDQVSGMTRVGWIRARQLANGKPVSRAIVGRMAAFARHRKNSVVAPEFSKQPWRDAGYVAWLGWGGTTGVNWASEIVAAEKKSVNEGCAQGKCVGSCGNGQCPNCDCAQTDPSIEAGAVELDEAMRAAVVAAIQSADTRTEIKAILESLIQESESGADCGTGAGGFKAGNTCAAGDGGGAGEEKKPEMSGKIKKLIDEAGKIEFVDEVVDGGEEVDIDSLDTDYITGFMSRSDENQLDERLAELSNEAAVAAADDEEPEIDEDEIIEEAGWDERQVANRARGIVGENKEILDAIDQWEDGDYAKGGVDGVDALKDHLEETLTPEAKSSEEYKKLGDAMDDARDRIQSDMDDARYRLEDRWREDFINNYEWDDYHDYRENWIREWASDNSDLFRGGDGEKQYNKWGLASDDSDNAAYVFEVPGGEEPLEYTINVWDRKRANPTLVFSDAKGSYKVTGKAGPRAAAEVFRNVTAATVRWLDVNEPETLSFSAAEESRQKLYDRLVKTTSAALPQYAAYAKQNSGYRQYILVRRDALEANKQSLTSPGGELFNYEPLVESVRLREIDRWFEPSAWIQPKSRSQDNPRDLTEGFDCGTGKGGFKPGNTCATGGTGKGMQQANLPQASELQKEKLLGGSTGAELHVDKNGKRYVVKQGDSPEHVRSEAVANALYSAAEVPIPRSQLDDSDPSAPRQIAEYVEAIPLGKTGGQQRADAIAELRKGFAADALFANWDVVGLAEDNVLVPASGPPLRVDNGGSLEFRAQGKPKAFTGVVGEIDSLRTSPQGKPIFGSLTDDEIATQIDGLVNRRKPILDAAPESIREVLARRLDYMQGWAEKKRTSSVSAKAIAPLTSSGIPKIEFKETQNSQDFVAARNKSSRPENFSELDPQKLGKSRKFLSADGKTGCLVDENGDLGNVFNNGGPKGAGMAAVIAGIKGGARTLDCYDGFLPDRYAQMGFVATGKMRWNDDYAPPGWDYNKLGRPDVVVMSYQGGPRDTIQDRVGTFKPYSPLPDTAYVDDYDSAKETARLSSDAP